MDPFPTSRFFRLSDEGVRCDQNGLFIGGAPMLIRSTRPDGGHVWAMRPANEQNNDLSIRYGFPIDIAAKREGLARVAQALERGDVALAQISALLLRLPDPPTLAKDGTARAPRNLTRQLLESGLLKADWDPTQHPRAGQPPNPGWFAPKDDAPADAGGVAPISEEGEPLVPTGGEVAEPSEKPRETESTAGSASGTEPLNPDLPPRGIMQALRAFLKAETFSIVQSGVVVDWAVEKLTNAIAEAVANLQAVAATSPPAVQQIVLRALKEALAAQILPKLSRSSGLTPRKMQTATTRITWFNKTLPTSKRRPSKCASKNSDGT